MPDESKNDVNPTAERKDKILRQFGEQVRKYRMQADLTLKKAAPRLELSYGQLAKIERGAVGSLPDIGLASRMSSVYDVAFAELLEHAGLEGTAKNFNKASQDDLEIAQSVFDDAVGPEQFILGAFPEQNALQRALLINAVLAAFRRGYQVGRDNVGRKPERIESALAELLVGAHDHEDDQEDPDDD